MRRWTAVAFGLALASCAAEGIRADRPAPAPGAALLTGTFPGDLLPSFTAKVRRPDGPAAREESLDLAPSKGTTVLVVMSTTCPYCAEAVEPLRRAEDAFLSRGVDFVYLYPMRAESAEEKAVWHGRMGFRAGQVIDADAALARLLEADKTPTAFLVDGRGVLLYRGAVIEAAEGEGPAAHPLADALEEHLAGKAITVSSSEPAG